MTQSGHFASGVGSSFSVFQAIDLIRYADPTLALRPDMKRREFLGAVGAAAVAFPLSAPAQQSEPIRVIGYLGVTTPSDSSDRTNAFVQGLRELGWIEGRNVAIEVRWAEGRAERYSEIATEFVHLKVDVIVTAGGAVLAAKQATSVIPIVFAVANDPVGSGMVASLARPGGNVTGLSLQFTDIAGKRLEVLRETVPGLRRLGVMANIGYPGAVLESREVQAMGRALGLEIARVEIQRPDDIPLVFKTLKSRADALYVCADPLLGTHRTWINSLALATRTPTMHGNREHVEAGGLMCYGANFPDLYRRAANFVDKILRGTKPADIPFEQPTKFDFVINLKTAKSLGLDISPTLLARANEVIE
jgi:putative tryptophan/tyrosine transport system substrate-binding protein